MDVPEVPDVCDVGPITTHCTSLHSRELERVSNKSPEMKHEPNQREQPPVPDSMDVNIAHTSSKNAESNSSEVENLRVENDILRATLTQFRKDHPLLQSQNLKGHKPPDGWEQVSFCESVREKLRSPDWFKSLMSHEKAQSGIFIHGDEASLDGCADVGMVDPDSIDWWTLVPSDPEGQESDSPSEESKSSDEELGGPYVLVEESDVVEAVAEFVALCAVKLPEVSHLQPTELQEMVCGAFDELRTKGFFESLWSWSTFAYNSYSYSSVAYKAYSHPLVTQMLMRAFWAISRWVAIAAL
eukprot:434367_1